MTDRCKHGSAQATDDWVWRYILLGPLLERQGLVLTLDLDFNPACLIPVLLAQRDSVRFEVVLQSADRVGRCDVDDGAAELYSADNCSIFKRRRTTQAGGYRKKEYQGHRGPFQRHR